MMCGEHGSLDFIKSSQNGPYSFAIASSASSSSASVWSEASSQSSQSSSDTSISAVSLDSSEQCDSYPFSRRPIPSQSDVQFRQKALSASWPGQAQSQQHGVPQEQRQNPRRTSSSATSRTGCPPPLVRQSDRKLNFVDNLVDSSTQIVEAIWPLSSVFHRQELGYKAVLPLRTFIQETLRRSRTSYSTLQVALYYLILIKPHVPKHDFTMEQPDDVHASRVLQCGRRMFLAALILASKYLQDRNYSARAWSKISGLATQEINQNEMAFLLAVNWKLHITDDVFKRWTDIVLKYTPSQPPSSGSACSQVVSEQQNQDWRNLILKLNPELDNIEDLIPLSPSASKTRDTTPVSPLSVLSALSPHSDRSSYTNDSSTPKTCSIPFVMEPAPATVYTPGRLAPALGLLPTPRLTPQSIGFSTPAASAASCLLSGKGSMGFAMAQAANVSASHNLDRWPGSISSSPQSYVSTRRSSLANSISTVSSPESMISDSSRTSRSSSISSASSLVSAPSTKLDVQARCRYAKLCGERYNLRPAIASVPEDYEENCITSSPESYTGTVGKDFVQMSLETPLARGGYEMDDATSAAHALQELHNYHIRTNTQPRPGPKLGAKRSRPSSMDNSLQENVREMLNSNYYGLVEKEWPDALIHGRVSTDPGSQQTPVQASNGGRKRVCCSSDARSYVIPTMHPAVGGAGGRVCGKAF
ncbi:PHO85 cyclin-5 [Parahypoxylon ruwenzoriense]